MVAMRGFHENHIVRRSRTPRGVFLSVLVIIALMALTQVSVDAAAVQDTVGEPALSDEHTAPLVAFSAEGPATYTPTPLFQMSPPDSLLRERASYWGPMAPGLQPRAARLADRPRPAWQTVVLVPYWVIGIPFRLLDLGIKGAAKGLNNIGAFNVLGPQAGFPGPWDSYILPMGSYGSSRGFQIGVNIFHDYFFGAENRLKIHASTSTLRADKASIGTIFRQLYPTTYQLGVGLDTNPGTRFYGIGPDTDEENEARYRRSFVWAGGNLRRTLPARWTLGARAIFTAVQARGSSYFDDDALSDVHAGNIPYGFGLTSYGWNSSLWFENDTTAESGRPRRGGFRRLGADFFLGSDGSGTRFWTYFAELEHFFGLGHPRRTLAARGYLWKTDNQGDTPVPVQRMIGNKRPNEFAGYPSYRFLDEGIVGGGVEYRWPIWAINEPNR